MCPQACDQPPPQCRDGPGYRTQSEWCAPSAQPDAATGQVACRPGRCGLGVWHAILVGVACHPGRLGWGVACCPGRLDWGCGM